MEPTTLTSLSGSLMSLFGLLVSLFSVHLGNWLSKLQGLRHPLGHQQRFR